MAHSTKRFARQLILKEVGPEGQARLEATEFFPGRELSDAERRFATMYAERAGLSLGKSPSSDDEHDELELLSGPIPEAFHHTASREIGIGAVRSLQAVLRALHFPPHPSRVEPQAPS